MLTPEQLEFRKSGIGGSDAPKICGVSAWGTPYTFYQERKNPDYKSPFANQNMMAKEIGNLFEPWLHKKYIELTGLPTIRNPIDYQNKRHSLHPFMIANIDGLNIDNHLVEYKTARDSRKWGQPGTDEIPRDYKIQISHYLAVCDLFFVDILVYFHDTQKLSLYKFQRDFDLEQMIIEREKDYWENYHMKDICPDPTNFEELQHFYRQSSEKEIEASDLIVSVTGSLRQIKDQYKELELEEKALKINLMNFMKENDTLLDHGQKIATWKSNKTSRLNTDLFKKEHPELYKKYLSENVQRRLLIY